MRQRLARARDGPRATAEGTGEQHIVCAVVMQIGNKDIRHPTAVLAPERGITRGIQRPVDAAKPADEKHDRVVGLACRVRARVDAFLDGP